MDRLRLLSLLVLLTWGLGKRTSRARARRQTTPKPGPTPPTTAPKPPAPAPGGPFWPVPAGKWPSSPRAQFGFQRTPTHRHQGVDIGAPEGSSVLTPVDGVVDHVNDAHQKGFGGYGKTVVVKAQIRGTTVWLLFAHLQRTEVKQGDKVSAGSRIGFVGRTKFTNDDPTAMFATSAAHLHFEASPRPYPQASEATRIDPTPVLKPLSP